MAHATRLRWWWWPLRANQPMHALLARPLDSVETAVVGCVDVLERSGDSLTAAWRMPLSVRQSKEAAFHLELSRDPRGRGARGGGSPGAAALSSGSSTVPSSSSSSLTPGGSSSTASSEWAWREVAGGMHGVHLVSGLEACTPYALRLRVDRDNRSSFGPVSPTAWTMCPPVRMEPPRVGCVAADGALLLWDAARSADAPATTYRVLARNASQEHATLLWQGPGQRLWLRDRAPGSLLEVSISASSVAVGPSQPSESMLLRVPMENPFLPPAQGAPVISSGFVVAWSAPPRCGPKPVTYRVLSRRGRNPGWRRDEAPGPGGDGFPDEVLACRGHETMCVLSGLSAGSSYLLQVLAYEEGELVHRSDVTAMLTAAATPSQPDPPRLVEATDETARIGWLPPADNGAPTVSYQLLLSDAASGGPYWQGLDKAPGGCAGHPEMRIPAAVGWHCAAAQHVGAARRITTDYGEWTAVYNGSAEAFNATALQPASTYYARLRAFNRLGASPWSHALTIHTTAGVPPVVRGLRQSGVYSYSARAAWEAATPRGEAIAGYTLQTKVLDIFAHSTRGGGEGGGQGEVDHPHASQPPVGSALGSAFDAAVRAAADAAADEPWVTRWQGSATSAEVEGLPANAVALMRVRANGASGAGGWSDVLQVHTRALAFGAPDAPHAEVARPLLRTSVKLHWATPRRSHAVAPVHPDALTLT